MELKPIGFVTEKENYYFYSYTSKSFYLTNPLLFKIIEIGEKKTIKILNILKKGVKNSYFGGSTIEEIEFYLKKHNFLKNNNIIDSKQNCVVKNPKINENDLVYEVDNCEQIVLEVTQKCNLNCVYCAYGFYYKDKHSLKMDLKYIDAIAFVDFVLVRKVKKYSGIKTHFEIGFYGGEPLLNINLIKQVIEYVEKKYSKYVIFKYKITTNGLLIRKHIKYFIEKNFKLSISLDGDNKHNYLRVFPNGKDSFDTIIENIKYIKKEYPKYFESNVLFLTVYHSKSNLKDIYNFFNEKYNKVPGISILSETGLDENKKDLFCKNIYKTIDKDQSIKDNFSEKSIYSDSDINYLSHVLKNIVNFFHPNIFKITDDTLRKVRILCSCIPFKNQPFLKADGVILPCTEVGSNAKVGELKNGKIQIPESKILEEFNKLTEKLNKFCQRCYNFDNCDFCVYRVEEKLLNKGKIVCDEFMSYNSALLFYKKIIDIIEEKKYSYEEVFKNLYSYDEI